MPGAAAGGTGDLATGSAGVEGAGTEEGSRRRAPGGSCVTNLAKAYEQHQGDTESEDDARILPHGEARSAPIPARVNPRRRARVGSAGTALARPRRLA